MSNVTRLPTASRRKVEQRWNARTRAERARLRAEDPWPGTYASHQQREAAKEAARLAEVERTPALVIAMALLVSLDADRRRQLVNVLAVTQERGPSHRQAYALARSTVLTVGEQLDLSSAIDALNAGRA